MATATQIKSLLRSAKNGDTKHLRSIALQIAASEEKKGHIKFAEEIKKIVSDLDVSPSNLRSININPVPLVQPTGDLKGLFEADYSKIKLNDLVLSSELRARIDRLITEQNSKAKLREFNLLPRSKILMVGAPGTGKTMTAKAIAGELQVPVFTVQLDRLLTKYMGEASSKLRLIFEQIKRIKGVYFFDEFDAVGSSRDLGNDIGEIRRILNTFLQFIEQAPNDSVILAATNHMSLLDKALFRRFDDVLEYNLPDKKLIIQVFRYRLNNLDTKNINWEKIAEQSLGLSFDEITKICHDIQKLRVLNSYKTLSNKIVLSAIKDRKNTKRS